MSPVIYNLLLNFFHINPDVYTQTAKRRHQQKRCLCRFSSDARIISCTLNTYLVRRDSWWRKYYSLYAYKTILHKTMGIKTSPYMQHLFRAVSVRWFAARWTQGRTFPPLRSAAHLRIYYHRGVKHTIVPEAPRVWLHTISNKLYAKNTS